MKYSVVQTEDNSYGVIEKTSGLIIETFSKMCDARHMMSHLNHGGGFDGFTPQFISKKLNFFYQNLGAGV